MSIELKDYLQWLLSPELLDEQVMLVISELRMPRLVATILVGLSLGSCGLVLQSVLRNPLGEPYTLGLSGGGALGAVIALGLNLEPWYLWIPGFSFLGCCLSAVIVLGLSSRTFGFQSRSIILFGIMVSLFFGALVVTIMSLLNPEKLQAALNWLLGEFGTTRDRWSYALFLPMVFLYFILLKLAPHLDALSLGDSRALSLGTGPKTYRIRFVIVATLMTAMSVTVSGLIGFIGLVSPHMARRLTKSSKHRGLLIYSALIGASLLTWADATGRLLSPDREIPAGSIAALLGAPLLVFLLMRPGHAQAD
ncbi:MAG: iron ABC transporter permease [Oligoflexia bacterium]|nr:iron ABC transporter permease [Oligoflexia bacterium]